jgi:hypothetical protein
LRLSLLKLLPLIEQTARRACLNPR